MKTYTIIGQPVRRVDGFEKVSGLIRYGVDMTEPGMLWVRTLRSPYPHARLVSIDTRRAEALPGVEAVVTAPTGMGSSAPISRCWFRLASG
jgi:CO/xanthine dehydrogenase Mo-binding subunit